MSSVVIGTGAGFNTATFFVNNLGQATGEQFTGQTSQTGSLLVGQSQTRFSAFEFQSGGLTYRYIGDWQVDFNNGILIGTVSASGTYSRIEVSNGTQVLAAADIQPRSVNFGTASGGGVLGLVTNLAIGVVSLLVGTPPQTEAVANLTLDATPGLNTAIFSDGVTVAGNAGPDTILGSAAQDVISAGDGNDTIFSNAATPGETGHDVVYAGLGNDNVYYVPSTTGSAFVLGGGNDSIAASSGNDVIYGDQDGELATDGADYLRGGLGNDLIYGGGGNDLIQGALSEGSDTVFGGSGDDTIGYNTADAVQVLNGGAGNDLIVGGSAGDVIAGDDGNDVLFGQGGNDVITGGAGSNNINGGDGNDTIVAGDGFGGFSYAVGEAGNDVLAAGTNQGAGLYGGAGNDTLIGGGQADNLIGGSGIDLITGGGGADNFIFNRGDLYDGLYDVITDLRQGDAIYLSTSVQADVSFQAYDAGALINIGNQHTIYAQGADVARLQASTVFLPTDTIA